MGKLKIVIWFICLLITVGTFYIMIVGTASPDKANGNGNPALFVLFTAYPAMISFYYLTINIGVRLILKTKNKRLAWILCSTSLIVCVALYFPIRSNAEAVKLGLEKSINKDYSKGWNQFTNTIYFNTYTFLLALFLCIVIATVISNIKITKEMRN
ncbi:hypothetical protein [Bacillus sp. FJAT-49736]|uniref:hypothetical protein n=1 Tax=Bacillus sp. FJAT-49736 TaxID=2833582 RepID=UPI001BC918DF|nr:hypothetical protein [Bacillus sp. FJAT-49736]MBS4175587.1 hypothetical protein [Bacillus sp. FJAT-49736]